MTDHDALTRAICEHRDEDTPRLILADWFQDPRDSGDLCDPDRAEFIRVQIEIANQRTGSVQVSPANDVHQEWLERREIELWRDNGQRWFGEWFDHMLPVMDSVKRGFLTVLTCTAVELDSLLAFRGSHPLEEIVLITVPTLTFDATEVWFANDNSVRMTRQELSIEPREWSFTVQVRAAMALCEKKHHGLKFRFGGGAAHALPRTTARQFLQNQEWRLWSVPNRPVGEKGPWKREYLRWELRCSASLRELRVSSLSPQDLNEQRFGPVDIYVLSPDAGGGHYVVNEATVRSVEFTTGLVINIVAVTPVEPLHYRRRST